MIGRAAFRGQPLLLLGGILSAWLALRIALWQPPFAPLPEAPRFAAARAAGPAARQANAERASPGEQAPARDASPAGFGPRSGALPQLPLAQVAWPVLPAAQPLLPLPVPRAPDPPLDPPLVAVGHNVLLAFGLSRMQVPAALLAYVQSEPARPLAPPPAGAAPDRGTQALVSRWSADGWLFLRRDGTRDARGVTLSDRPNYGRSQAGAAIRFDLAPGSALRPRAHLRGAAALAGPGQREAAVGLSLRPLPRVPVRTAVEARAIETGGDARFRPAAYAVTEFPPVELPGRLRGEAYVQAGYVGGTFATAFVDGQARAERAFTPIGATEFSAGAAAWGGAQKGSARLDIGPTATVRFRLGEAYGRVAADYRFRIAGRAEPASGPALTVSAGF